MSWMFEVYYLAPSDIVREKRIENLVKKFGGRLTCREKPDELSCADMKSIVLTFEFDDRSDAESAVAELKHTGEFTKGIHNYGD